MTEGPIRILLVDDDEDDYLLTRTLLSEIDADRFELDWLDSYGTAEAALKRKEHDLYLFDYSLGEHNGLDLLSKALELGCEAPVILVTGHEDRETDLRAMKAGAADYLVKGHMDARTLERSIRYALERKRSQEALRSATEAAQCASRAKSQFLANMSHEIRTPMCGVLGMTELLLGTEVTEQQREYLELARTSATTLLYLLNDILDLSKIEAARLELNPVAFSVRQCVEEAVRMLGAQAQVKGLELSATVDPKVPESLVGDPVRLRQVIWNLVGNAIKFTHEGAVSVTVAPTGWDGPQVTLRFDVRDSGIGIPADKQKLIFDPFRQADGSTTRQYGGTGLGLTISSRLVEMMGGSIGVSSKVGEGSTFHFEVGLARPAGEQAGTAGASLEALRTAAGGAGLDSESGLRILLVEDNLVNQKLATGLLGKLGHAVVVAGNGREAVRAAGSQPFDLILMDVQMPVMDGFEATAAIRRIEQDGGRRTPIVALTAHAMHGDGERCVRGGMDDYLTKPIDMSRLDAILAKWGRREVTA